MNILTKIISGDQLRPSRLHDEKGHFAGWRNVLLHAPPAIATGLLRLCAGYRPALPWISYSAIRILKSFLTNESRILEFGSGMSTVFYALHAREVCSVEDYPQWHEKVTHILQRRGLTNVQYKLAQDAQAYSTFMSDDPAGFDLIMVDGSHRAECIRSSAHLLKPGGILYLDNSDKDSQPQGGPMRTAEELLLQFAREKNAAVRGFTDFAPTQLFVQEGIMVTLPR